MKQSTTFRNIVVLTGAGVSAESGLKTFRDNDGLWEEHRVEDVCTPEAFVRDRQLVQRFYNTRRKQLIHEAHPNPAHSALANFAKEFTGRLTLITQNVDDLHERAGSRDVIHMHGELRKARCIYCDTVTPWDEDLDDQACCPECNEVQSLRPHIVWFGEYPLGMGAINQALMDCDLFLSIGTSGQVYPAAGFVQQAKSYGAHCVEINLEPSAGQSLFDEHHYGPASTTINSYLKGLLQ